MNSNQGHGIYLRRKAQSLSHAPKLRSLWLSYHNVSGIAQVIAATVITLLSSSIVVAQEVSSDVNALKPQLCQVNSQRMMASYQLSKYQGKQTINQRLLNVWRNDRQVAHEFKDAGITEIWQLQHNDRVHPVRYFDKHQRGIEYTANEVSNNNSQHLWQTKFQLITDDVRNGMIEVSSVGKGCEQRIRYERHHADGSETLIWLPQQQLVMHYEQRHAEHRYHISLKSVETDATALQKFYQQREQYQTTDYADVGDNESDPFLMNMVNLGFVKGGHSGFYSDKGEKLAGHEHH